MADLITTIKVNSSQFDNSIKESTNQIRKFESEAKKTGGSVDGFGGKLSDVAVGGIARFAGAIGAAVTSFEALNAIINSTDSLSDQFAITIEQAKSSVDYFFTTIATGDWSHFWGGLEESTRLAREYAEAMDDAEDKRMGFSMINTEEMAWINEQRAILSDPDASLNEKEAALKEIENSKNRLIYATVKYADATEKLATDLLNNASNAEWTIEEETRIPDIQAGLDEKYLSYINHITELESRYNAGKGGWVSGGGFQQPQFIEQTDDSAQAEALIKTWNNLYKEEASIREKWNRVNEKERQNYENIINDRIKTVDQIASLTRVINREKKKLYSEQKRKNKNEDEIFPEGSLADIDSKIKELNKQISLSIDPEQRRELFLAIEELNRLKVIIKVSYEYDGNFDPNDKVNQTIKPLSGQSEYLKDDKLDVSNVSITKPNISEKTNWFDTYRNALRLVREDNEGVLESFDSIAGVLSAIGNASDGSAAAMFRWVAATISSIGQAIPIIKALTLTKKAEANANTEAAASGAAASVAGIPVVGALLAVGAVATVLASLASIPKFANGGLVYGNTIAQVGEYAGASNNPEVIAPLNKLRKILSDSNEGGYGSVDFRISGKDLVGVINNYSSKNNKK